MFVAALRACICKGLRLAPAKTSEAATHFPARRRSEAGGEQGSTPDRRQGTEQARSAVVVGRLDRIRQFGDQNEVSGANAGAAAEAALTLHQVHARPALDQGETAGFTNYRAQQFGRRPQAHLIEQDALCFGDRHRAQVLSAARRLIDDLSRFRIAATAEDLRFRWCGEGCDEGRCRRQGESVAIHDVCGWLLKKPGP